jgi:hypothetical protein
VVEFDELVRYRRRSQNPQIRHLISGGNFRFPDPIKKKRGKKKKKENNENAVNLNGVQSHEKGEKLNAVKSIKLCCIHTSKVMYLGGV